MMTYVLGFAFDANMRVAMIKKDRPEWMAGRWNGIGGKLENSDMDKVTAMSREFAEETGLALIPDVWQHFATLRDRTDGYEIFCFVTMLTPGLLDRVTTTETEEVRVFTPAELQTEGLPLMPNLTWLMPMSLCLAENEIPVVIEYPLRETDERHA